MATAPAQQIPTNPQPIEQVPVRIEVPRGAGSQDAPLERPSFEMAAAPAAPIPARPQPIEQVPVRREDQRPREAK